MKMSEGMQRVALAVGALAFVASIVAALSFSGGDDDYDEPAVDTTPDTTPIVADTERSVVFEFYGTAPGVDFTFGFGLGGDTSQLQDRAVPMQIESKLDPGTWVYWSGQNTGSGDLTCRIRVDGVTFKEITSSGDYVIATCSGEIP